MNYWLGTVTPPRILFEIGPVHVYWYSILVVTGIAVGLFVARRYWLTTHSTDKKLVDAAFWAILGGLLGARLWHVFIFQWTYYSQHPSEIFAIWEGGIAIQGALLGGLLALWMYVRKHRLRLLEMVDAAVIGLPLGQAIGRWGNFFNQELYGVPTSKPWGIYIEESQRVEGYLDASHFHPTFFYESLLNLILFLFIFRLSKKKHMQGLLAGVYAIGYGIVRFVVDFLRIDPMPFLGPLRYSQWISIGLIIIGCCILIYAQKRAESVNSSGSPEERGSDTMHI